MKEFELSECQKFLIYTVSLLFIGLITFVCVRNIWKSVSDIYSSAPIITTDVEFDQCIDNNIGYALVCGNVSTDDHFDEYAEILPNCLKVSRIYEYNESEVYLVNGKPQVRSVWKNGEEVVRSVKTVRFLGNTYPIDKLNLCSVSVDLDELGVENTSNYIYTEARGRYYFTYVPNNLYGCILVNFSNNQANFVSEFYNLSVEELIVQKIHSVFLWDLLFWFVWIIFVMPMGLISGIIIYRWLGY